MDSELLDFIQRCRRNEVTSEELHGIIVEPRDPKRDAATGLDDVTSRSLLPQWQRGPLHDLTGQRFGRLTVVSYAGQHKYGRLKQCSEAQWDCVCDCGNEVTVPTSSLRKGYTRSCGCLRRERNQRLHEEAEKRRAGNNQTKHGEKGEES